MPGGLRDLSDSGLISEYQHWRLIHFWIKRGNMYSWELDRMNQVAAEVKERMMPFSPEPPESCIKD